MVVVKLSGGLGNQMFQYACARRLAHVRSAALKLDVSALEVPNGRLYALSHFNISAEIATRADILRFKSPSLTRRVLRRIGLSSLSYRERNVVRERHFHYDETILTLPGNVYLEGYWQCERYFMDVEAVIRREFTVKQAPDGENARIAEKIANVNAVSVHVRRGDYVSNAKVHEVHGVCPLDYYDRAARLIAQSLTCPHFFVFSDDPGWARSNVKFQHEATYLDHNSDNRAYEDLRLMSLCRHHIIANSSFSWWGAWLGQHAGKIVIAPSKWFNNSSGDTRDLLPKTWLTL